MYKIFPPGNNSNIRYINERNGVPDKQNANAFNLDPPPVESSIQKKN